jgi:LmbE family N-acetylglucosaminyl deacetylase
MAVFAHPDDETLGLGGTLARYAAEGIETHLLTATRGERGWRGPAEADPGFAALGQIREAELRAAAEILGLTEVALLDYVDGDLDQAEPAEAIGRITGHLRRIRPQVVVTFGPDGAYGHPDHIAICQFTTAAVAAAADPAYAAPGGYPPFRVAKLYYMIDADVALELYERLFGTLAMPVDGIDRTLHTWPNWAVTTWIDARPFWQQVWQAAQCHRSQMADLAFTAAMSDEDHRQLWGRQTFYRAISHVNGGRTLEADLFAGLRD